VRLDWLVAIAACGGGRPAGPPPALTVDTVRLAPTTVTDSSEYLATLRSRTAAVLQPQVDGQVVAILVKPGDIVERGQPLLQIDPHRQQATVNQARASRVGREAALALAERNRDRIRALYDQGAATRQDLDNAETAVHTARADVEALGAEIQANQVQLGYFRVDAPGHGAVGDIPVRVGDRVTAQTVLTSVTDNQVLEANVSIPVSHARGVHRGTEIRLVDDAGTTLAAAPVSFVSQLVNAQTQSVLVKAYVDNTAGGLRSDQLVRARVVWSSRSGLVVPAIAVTRLGGQAFVFVIESQHGAAIAHQRPVTLGELVDNNYPVVSGLAAGDTIVTSNLQKLRDGAHVAPAH
jgi:RND family efflux transporter MFP subunit